MAVRHGQIKAQSSPPNQPCFTPNIWAIRLPACTTLARGPSPVVPWGPDLNPFAIAVQVQANQLVQGVKDAGCVLGPGISQRGKDTEVLGKARSEHPCMCPAPGMAPAACLLPFLLLLLFAGFTPAPVINGLWSGWKRAQTEAFTNPLSLQQGHNSGFPSPRGMGGRRSCSGSGGSTDVSPLVVNALLGDNLPAYVKF